MSSGRTIECGVGLSKSVSILADPLRECEWMIQGETTAMLLRSWIRCFVPRMLLVLFTECQVLFVGTLRELADSQVGPEWLPSS